MGLLGLDTFRYISCFSHIMIQGESSYAYSAVTYNPGYTQVDIHMEWQAEMSGVRLDPAQCRSFQYGRAENAENSSTSKATRRVHIQERVPKWHVSSLDRAPAFFRSKILVVQAPLHILT